MLELDVGIALGDALGRVHEAERGGEHDVGAIVGHLADDALGIGALIDVLDIDGLDPVAEGLLESQSALVVLVGPSVIADRADIDEAGLHRILRVGRPDRQRQCGGRGGECQILHAMCSLWNPVPFEAETLPAAIAVLSPTRDGGIDHRSGTNGWPRLSGVLARAFARSREIMTRTTMVAK